MKVFKLRYYEVDDRVVDEAYRVLKKCGLIVAGTDTVYGLLATPYLDECVLKVYKVKKRPLDKPIPLLSSSLDAVLSVVDTEYYGGWIKKFLSYLWPGPVTVILKTSSPMFSKHISIGRDEVGFRIPATPIIRSIASMNGGFITGTSANISGAKPPMVVDEAIRYFGEEIDVYIDLGEAPLKKPSTVIRISSEGFEVVREGSVSIETLDILFKLAVK